MTSVLNATSVHQLTPYEKSNPEVQKTVNAIILIFNVFSQYLSMLSHSMQFDADAHIEWIKLNQTATEKKVTAENHKAYFQLGGLVAGGGTIASGVIGGLGVSKPFAKAVEGFSSLANPLTHYAVSSKEPALTRVDSEKRILDANHSKRQEGERLCREMVQALHQFILDIQRSYEQLYQRLFM